MSQVNSNDGEAGPDKLGLSILALAVAALVGLYFGGPGLRLGFLAAAVVVISIAIWQACDPFADAAQWIGEQFRLPGSVRGATLDAIASSMPELFSGIFFVVVAMRAGGDQVATSAEGFGSTIATCAGSAVYNMILIPAVVALVVAAKRKDRPTVDVEPEVVTRDGLWFVGCELVLVVFLLQDTMHWWMGVVFLVLYCLYILHLYFDAVRYRGRMEATSAALEKLGAEASIDDVISQVRTDGHRISTAHVLKAQDGGDDDRDDSAGIFFGFFEVGLSHATAWSIIVLTTIAAAGACYFLVEVTRELAIVMNVPTFFVAVIVAAAASSVPDTFLSVGSGLRGDDSGAVSNAFGSNIFDICVCLSVPLLVNSYLLGWEPVSLMQDGKPIQGLVGLRILLVVLTVITLAIIWHKRQLTRNKALVLCGLYVVFVAYAVLGSLGYLT